MGLIVTDALLDGERVGLRCEGGLIEALGPEVAPGDGEETIDAGGMLLVPPFVNAHTHAAMTLFRGFGDDLPLMEWLEGHIWPAEARLKPEDVYWGTRLAAIEMIRSGTTRFVDMYWHEGEAARAVGDAGLRAVISSVFIDGLDPGKGEGMRPAALAQLDEIQELAAADGRVDATFGPHAIYTVSAESLRWLAEQAAERGLGFSIHLSETQGEVDDCLEAHGIRPAHYLDELGCLGERAILAHGVFLDDAELELIAERGATVAINTSANSKLAVGGAFPYGRAREAGVRVGLGTDGVSSNNNLDMFEEVKLFSLMAKHDSGDPAAAPAGEALEIARGLNSPALGGTPLEPGEPADFLLLDPETPELSVGDLDAGLVYAATGSVVDTTVVAGRALMRGREVEGEAEAIAEVRARAARLTSPP
ncbi:MAG: amidohydrolase [Actinobacteria bacterium]|nr:amidohydrolase [Actinomycetota bacterium]